MNQRVAKFNIPAPRASGRFDLTMPEGAELLGVGLEAGAAVVWALVDPDAPDRAAPLPGRAHGRHAPELRRRSAVPGHGRSRRAE